MSLCPPRIERRFYGSHPLAFPRAGTKGGGIYSFRPYLGVARADMAAFLHRMDEYGLVKRA